jgi:hypothetical protein
MRFREMVGRRYLVHVAEITLLHGALMCVGGFGLLWHLYLWETPLSSMPSE